MPYNIYCIFVYLIFMSLIVLYFLHSKLTSVLSFHIDVVLTLYITHFTLFIMKISIFGKTGFILKQDHGICDIRPKRILNTNLAKSRLPITYF